MPVWQPHASEKLEIVQTQNIVQVLDTLAILIHPAPDDKETSAVRDEVVAGVVVFVFERGEGVAPVGSSVRVRGVEGAHAGVEFRGIVYFRGDGTVSGSVCPERECTVIRRSSR